MSCAEIAKVGARREKEDNMAQMQTEKKRIREIRAYPEKCSGCMACQLACSLAYTKSFNPLKSRIIINGIGDIERQISFTEECNNCGICVKYCNYGALEEVYQV
jgi:ferredoxin